MPIHYPNTYKAIYSINEHINDIFMRLLHDVSFTLEIILTGYPEVL